MPARRTPRFTPVTGRPRAPNKKPIGSDTRGVLASADDAASELLGSSGFVDIAAPFQENFTRCLRYHPVALELEDLKPGALAELRSLVRSKIAVDPEPAWAAQARVDPAAALWAACGRRLAEM